MISKILPLCVCARIGHYWLLRSSGHKPPAVRVVKRDYFDLKQNHGNTRDRILANFRHGDGLLCVNATGILADHKFGKNGFNNVNMFFEVCTLEK